MSSKPPIQSMGTIPCGQGCKWYYRKEGEMWYSCQNPEPVHPENGTCSGWKYRFGLWKRLLRGISNFGSGRKV